MTTERKTEKVSERTELVEAMAKAMFLGEVDYDRTLAWEFTLKHKDDDPQVQRFDTRWEYDLWCKHARNAIAAYEAFHATHPAKEG